MRTVVKRPEWQEEKKKRKWKLGKHHQQDRNAVPLWQKQTLLGHDCLHVCPSGEWLPRRPGVPTCGHPFQTSAFPGGSLTKFLFLKTKISWRVQYWFIYFGRGYIYNNTKENSWIDRRSYQEGDKIVDALVKKEAVGSTLFGGWNQQNEVKTRCGHVSRQTRKGNLMGQDDLRMEWVL